jgi:exonuclease VII small subunit
MNKKEDNDIKTGLDAMVDFGKKEFGEQDTIFENVELSAVLMIQNATSHLHNMEAMSTASIAMAMKKLIEGEEPPELCQEIIAAANKTVDDAIKQVEEISKTAKKMIEDFQTFDNS